MSNKISVINTGHALMSLRDSGFSFSSALGEVIDNALQACALNIDVKLFKEGRSVTNLAITDDGIGMSDQVLHRYLVIGESTRYGATEGIGRFGLGAKLAALNFATKIRVWSRDSTDKAFKYVSFDLNEAFDAEKNGLGHQVGIDEPIYLEVDEQYKSMVKPATKTIVVWDKIDKLEDGRVSTNTDELIGWLTSELGRIFRNYIKHGINLTINDKHIKHFDPAMLLKNSIQDYILTKTYSKGDTTDIQHFPSTIIADKVPVLTLGDEVATMTVTLYNKAVTRNKGQGGDKLAKRLKVPENQGRVSFVRCGREISYTNVPMLFSRNVIATDRYTSITIEFPPVFDSMMGVRNVKRGVEPFSKLRAEIRSKLKVYLNVAGRLLEQQWSDEVVEFDESLIDEAINNAMDDLQQEEVFELPQIDLITLSDETSSATPYVIQENIAATKFISFSEKRNKSIIMLDKQHPMFQQVWKPLRDMSFLPSTKAAKINPIQTAKAAFNGMNLIMMALSETGMSESQLEVFSEKLGLLVEESVGQ